MTIIRNNDSAMTARIDVPTYICCVTLQEALKTEKFFSERHKAILNVLYTAYWFKSQTSGMLKEFGLTMEQFNVLRILKGKHPHAMCVRDIGSRMIEKSSNVPRIMDKLVQKELVSRSSSQEDKRETLHQLTDAAIQLLDKVNTRLVILDDEILGITEQEATLLHQLLEKSRSK